MCLGLHPFRNDYSENFVKITLIVAMGLKKIKLILNLEVNDLLKILIKF
jgi:hypothetical protein